MDDLISRQAAINAMQCITDSICAQQAIDALSTLPSDERREGQPSECEYWDDESNFCTLNRPYAERRGRWETEITTNRDGTKSARYACSVCGVMALDEWHYCPNCGAQMDLEENDG